MKEVAKSKGIDTKGVDWEDGIVSNKELKSEFDEYINSQEDKIKESINKEISISKEIYKKKYWNATKMDIAAAVLSSSPDSLVKNIRFNKVEAWMTYSVKAGKNGQFLMGVNSTAYMNLRDTAKATKNDVYYTASVPFRYMMGSNRVKVFAEGHYQYISANKGTNLIIVNMGAELNLVDGFWLHFTGGLKSDLNTGISTYIANLTMKITLPEKFKF